MAFYKLYEKNQKALWDYMAKESAPSFTIEAAGGFPWGYKPFVTVSVSGDIKSFLSAASKPTETKESAQPGCLDASGQPVPATESEVNALVAAPENETSILPTLISAGVVIIGKRQK